MLSTYVALLRAVNVGGNNKLPMKDLVEMFVDAGCTNVRTYIQSGNVLFSAAPRLAAQLPATISAEIAKRFGYKTPVILRTPEQLREVIRRNPFLKAGAAEETLHIMFLAGTPKPSDIDRLDPARSAPDEFIVLGQEIYLRLPNGMGRTKLLNSYFDSKLATTSTARNWRTVLKLLELSESR
jgi:uncharacterized protein (DUF1697 family)